jgi:predicted acylesterase/phospholipase RssA
VSLSVDANPTSLPEQPSSSPFRLLSLDGGGAKAFYTLGILHEVEGLTKKPLSESFQLIYGTSTGAIIASLLALRYSVAAILDIYRNHVPRVMRRRGATAKSAALRSLATEVFGDHDFTHTVTRLGVVATRWVSERPMIFKSDTAQAHGRKGTFVPGFGVTIADAVCASCSAVPFFERAVITTSDGHTVELIDGGYSANNPTLYAIADATHALRVPRRQLHVLSLGVGVYPEPQKGWLESVKRRCIVSIPLLYKTLECNTQSMERLCSILYSDVRTCRISDTFDKPEMATDFMEHDMAKLSLLHQRGRDSFGAKEAEVRQLFDGAEHNADS